MIRKKKKEPAKKEVVLPDLEFKPKVGDKQQTQGVLIACRNMEQYGPTVMLTAQAIKGRADQFLMDFSAQGVAIRFRVDGMWENMPPMDRVTGDGALVIYKRLCGLNPGDRRSRQQGKLAVKYRGEEWHLDFASQGIPSGERVLIKIDPKKMVLKGLPDLGMREKMQTQLRELLNKETSLFLFSGIPGQALPTSWRVGLESADRFVRDFHSIEAANTEEPELINITQHTFDPAAGETPMTVLKSLLLKQPDVLVFPDFYNAEVVALMMGEIKKEDRKALTRIEGSNAVEGLLNLLAKYPEQRADLLEFTSGVLNQRIIRRLCTECRQAFQPAPQLLQKLGIPQGRVKVLYQPTIPPPPEQRVDANGKPIEIQICKKCHGRGYYGRAGLYELLTIDDVIRDAVRKSPTPEYVTAAARQQGFLSFQEEGVLAVATGLTSIQEIQRVLSPKR